HAATVEQTLAPVEYLLTKSRTYRHIGDIPVAVNVGIEDFCITTSRMASTTSKAVVFRDVLARLISQAGIVVIVALVHDLCVIERGATDENPVILVRSFQIGGNLKYLGNQASVEIAVTVVGVDVVVGLVLALYAPQLAVGDGGVNGAGDFVVGEAELHRLRLSCNQQRQNTSERKA